MKSACCFRIVPSLVACLFMGSSLAALAQAPELAAAVPPPKAVKRLVVWPVYTVPHFKVKYELPADLQDVIAKTGAKFFFDPKLETNVEDVSFTQSLISRFVASRKFDVLDREGLKKLIKEIDLGESDYGDKATAVRAGQMWNADYVLSAVVENILLSYSSKEVPYTDIVKTRLFCRLDLSFQLTEVKTSKIISANQLSLNADYGLRNGEAATQTMFQDLLKQSYSDASRQLLEAVIDTVYPVKVVGVEGSEVFINRGESTLAVGDVFGVYRAGKAMVDPDTGENLGVTEAKLGDVAIVRVMPKVAVGAPLPGQPQFTPVVGDICREAPASVAKRANRTN